MKNLRNAMKASNVFLNKTMLRILSSFVFLPALTWAGERTFGNGTLPEHLAIYDVDGSGGLNEEELQVLQEDRLNRQRRLRNRWDTDKDGKISNAEREAAKAAIRRTIEQRRVKRFNEVDLDRNGQLTLTEFRNITAVSDADTNTPGVALRIFKNLDSDKNEMVSTREFLLKLDSLPPDVVDIPPANEHPKRPITNSPARPR
jgi:hypothetical protein